MKVLDIFSGIGGFSLGLERAGFETVAFCEQEEYCQKVLKKHWPYTPIFEDVRKLNIETLDTILPNDVLWQDIDVICGGFPCQDISVAGKQKGLKGERSGLWREFKRLIQEVRPRYAIIENVANLRSNGLSTVLKDLWEIGYDSEWHIISASSVGALHKRERIWIIAYPYRKKLWERQRRRDEKGITISDSSSIGLDERAWKKRFIQTDKEWDDTETQPKRKQRKFEFGPNGQILSQGALANIRDSYSDFWSSLSRVHRVTNGLSKKMERDRKKRIKALGNAVVPQIPELIGREILNYELRKTYDEVFN